LGISPVETETFLGASPPVPTPQRGENHYGLGGFVLGSHLAVSRQFGLSLCKEISGGAKI